MFAVVQPYNTFISEYRQMEVSVWMKMNTLFWMEWKVENEQVSWPKHRNW